jgi:DNA-binding XRE family transcriptional regulator
MLANGTETQIPFAARPILKPGAYVNQTSLREYRLKAGIGSKALADKADVPAFVVYQIETGHLNPRIHARNLAKLAKALDVPVRAVMAPCQLTAEQMAELESVSKAPRVGKRQPKSKKLLALPAPVPAAVPVEHRTGRGQVQKLGIALTYDGNIIGGASLNLDAKALTPLIKRLLRAALDDD